MSSNETTQLVALLARPSVLIVDDDELVSGQFAGVISQEGYSVHTCRTGREALMRLHESFSSIVVTDLGMPDMDGLELCARIRGIELKGYVYIIVFTGDSREDRLVQALRAGADDYIRKSASPDQILARLAVAERIVTLEQRLRRTLIEKTRLATSDGLTGLANRRAFDQQFNADFKRAQRFSEDLSVLLIDIDHFKQVNDRYGHLVGDEVLKGVAHVLGADLPRDFDFLARFGGEEFAVLLPGTDREGAVHVAERLRAGVESARIQVADGTLQVTASIGISSLRNQRTRDSVTPADLLQQADICLYASKRSGRNRVTASDRIEISSLAQAYREAVQERH